MLYPVVTSRSRWPVRVMFASSLGESWRLSTAVIVIVSTKATRLSCTPEGTLRIVRRCVVLHGSLAAFIDSLSSIVAFITSCCVILLGTDLSYGSLVDSNLPTLGSDLYNDLSVICSLNSAFVAFPFSFRDFNIFTNQSVFEATIDCGNCSILVGFDVLITKDQNIPTVLNENAIRLIELFVPQEESVLVDVLNGASTALVLATDDLNDVVSIDGVSVRVNSGSLVSLIDLLVDVTYLNISNLSFIVNDF